MIIQIVGNVSYPITLDPSVWIFDKRKVLFEEAFNQEAETTENNDSLKRAAKRYEREVFQHKVNDNENISKKEGEEILKNTYVMPIYDFLHHTEVNDGATAAELINHNDEKVAVVSIDELENGYLLFAKNGKPIKDDGPVYLYYGDGSNKDNPIKNIKKINIV